MQTYQRTTPLFTSTRNSDCAFDSSFLSGLWAGKGTPRDPDAGVVALAFHTAEGLLSTSVDVTRDREVFDWGVERTLPYLA
jgi:hypothetical protein